MPKEIKLGMKDKRILRELFADGRSPMSIIAKNVGLSKQVVQYRIKRLIDNGLLIGFNTVIDVNKLGWKLFFIYVKLQNVDNLSETGDKIRKNPNIMWFVKCMGNYDYVLKICAKDIVEVHRIIDSISSDVHIESFQIDFIDEEHPVPLPFIYAPIKPAESHYRVKSTEEKVKYDDIDLMILQKLAHDARISCSDLSKEIGLTESKVRYHLQKLEKEVIVTYRPSAWSGTKSIGYSWYLVMLKLGNIDKERFQEFLSYTANLPFLTYYYRTIGEFQFAFEIRLKIGDELDEIITNMRNILKEDLKSHSLSLILKEYVYTYFPECLVG